MEEIVEEASVEEVREDDREVCAWEEPTPRPLGRNPPRSNRGVPPPMAPGVIVPPLDSHLKIALTPIVIQPPLLNNQIPDEPSFKVVLRTTGPDQAVWDSTIKADGAMLRVRETWDNKLVSVPSGQKAVTLQWVFLIKRDTEGVNFKHKAQLVVRGTYNLKVQTWETLLPNHSKDSFSPSDVCTISPKLPTWEKPLQISTI